ncbi:MAG: hypothetical protein R3B06_10205 [Kofleriaceae bacterium]
MSLPPAHVIGRPTAKLAANVRQVSRGAVVAAKVALWLCVVVSSLVAIASFAVRLSPHHVESEAQIKVRQQAIVQADRQQRERARERASRATAVRATLEALMRVQLRDAATPAPPAEPVATR